MAEGRTPGHSPTRTGRDRTETRGGYITSPPPSLSPHPRRPGQDTCPPPPLVQPGAGGRVCPGAVGWFVTGRGVRRHRRPLCRVDVDVVEVVVVVVLRFLHNTSPVDQKDSLTLSSSSSSTGVVVDEETITETSSGSMLRRSALS